MLLSILLVLAKLANIPSLALKVGAESLILEGDGILLDVGDED